MRIFKHTKGLKARGIKLKGRLKILSVHKLKRHIGRKYKKMFTSQIAMLNIVDDENTTAQSIPLGKNIPPDETIRPFTEKTSRQLSPKCRKKQCNQGAANKCFTDDITNWDDSEQQIKEKGNDNWKIDFSNEELKGRKDDDLAQVSSTEQRNLDSPIVVKMPLDDCTALSVPKIFEQRSKAQSEIDTYDRNVFARETWSKENNARIIDSECVNPDNARSLAEHKESALPMPWDANETNETEDNGAISNNELGNVAVNKVGGVNVARRESVESSDRSTNSNNDAVAYKSLQLEDTGELCHENDPNSEAEDSEAISNSGLKEASLQDPKNVRAHKVKQPQLYSIRNIVIVIMEKDSAFGFTGKLSVKVLYGAVEVYGAILNASKDPVEVYSPRGYSNVIINTCGEVPDDTIDQIWTKFNADGITRDSETTLFENIDKVKPGMAVLVLRNIENNLTHFLKTYYPLRLFPDVKNSSYYPWTDYRRAEMVLQAQLQVKYHDLRRRGLFIDSRISDIANGMLTRWRANKWSCALIAGGKDVGKSTSVRFLINKLLHTCEKVVLIDVDPGQSECTPYSCVSYSLIEQPLLGPNFTHLQTPVYQLFIGEIDVMQCATRYLEAIKMLITKLKSCSELSRLPIVVNTMGFTQYVGWYLLISTVKLIRPSVILQILSAKNRNNYRNWLNADTVNKQDRKWTLHNIPLADWYKPCDHELFVMHSNAESKEARVPKKWNMEPYQQRELVMISYLSDITRDSYDPFQCDEDQSLKINEVVPYMSVFHNQVSGNVRFNL